MARRGLEVGKRAAGDGGVWRREGEDGCGAAPLMAWLPAEMGAAVLMLSLREKLGWWACVSPWERLLLAVDCDQRLRLAVPSWKAPMPSAAPLAALERRREEGGGVARRWGGDGSGAPALSESEAVRVRVADDDESEAARDGRRRWAWAAAGSAVVGGGGAGVVAMFAVPASSRC